MRKNRFEGWYFKQQKGERTLALIAGAASGGAFIQVITDACSYCVNYPREEYTREDEIHIGGSTFFEKGISLNIHSSDITMTGELIFTGLTPIKGDIMGPFRFFPMECRHGIVSMRHAVSGTVVLNGETLCFDGGTGYMETDTGRSFPGGYTWVHCNDLQNCSVVASVARIPFAGMRFQGCIAVVWLEGREYRLATYNGVKILRCERGLLKLAHGRYRLDIIVEAEPGEVLYAPQDGLMSRTIRENISCPARFRFTENDKLLFEGNGRASYEYAY